MYAESLEVLLHHVRPSGTTPPSLRLEKAFLDRMAAGVVPLARLLGDPGAFSLDVHQTTSLSHKKLTTECLGWSSTSFAHTLLAPFSLFR